MRRQLRHRGCARLPKMLFQRTLPTFLRARTPRMSNEVFMPTRISPKDAAALAAEGKAVLVDVREPDEYRRLRIPTARLMPLSVLSLLPQENEQHRTAVFFCRSGGRTQEHEAELRSRGFERFFILDGGITAWKAAGLEVIEEVLPLPLMRQVQIGAGALVLLFLLLGAATPAFYWGAAFIGAGLVFAGITGFCGLARILVKMPWNKKL